MRMEEKEKRPVKFEPLTSMGVFFVVFGLIVSFATLVPEELLGKLINFFSGIAFLVIGLFCLFLGIRQRRKFRDSQKKDEKL